MIAWLKKAWAWLKENLWVWAVVGAGALVLAWRTLRGQVEKARQERDVAKVDAAKEVVEVLEAQRAEVLREALDAAEARARVEGRDAEVAEAIRYEERRIAGMSAEDVAEEFRRLRQDASTPRLGTPARGTKVR